MDISWEFFYKWCGAKYVGLGIHPYCCALENMPNDRRPCNEQSCIAWMDALIEKDEAMFRATGRRNEELYKDVQGNSQKSIEVNPVSRFERMKELT